MSTDDPWPRRVAGLKREVTPPRTYEVRTTGRTFTTERLQEALDAVEGEGGIIIDLDAETEVRRLTVRPRRP